jgi:hypothetical protein
MSWSIGYDTHWKRDIGYGVPAYCDHPGCLKKIDRGLAHVCGGEPHGGEFGCGLYFCSDHLYMGEKCQLCEMCDNSKPLFEPTPDHSEWIAHKLSDDSWEEWREQNKETVLALTKQLYYELIMAVESKHEGETRHETALRYIRERELACAGSADATHTP